MKYKVYKQKTIKYWNVWLGTCDQIWEGLFYLCASHRLLAWQTNMCIAQSSCGINKHVAQAVDNHAWHVLPGIWHLKYCGHLSVNHIQVSRWGGGKDTKSRKSFKLQETTWYLRVQQNKISLHYSVGKGFLVSPPRPLLLALSNFISKESKA